MNQTSAPANSLPATPDFSFTENPSRTGKIARLPRKIRDELNTRIEDGVSAIRLAQWLNSLKEVRKILDQDFKGRDISEQNLSDWKHGGYRDWQRQRALREQVRLIAEQAADLESPNAHKTILDNLAAVLAAELSVATQILLAETTDPKQRWLYLRQAAIQLQQLRRSNYIAARARMELERWEIESSGLLRDEAKAARIAAADARQSESWARSARSSTASPSSASSAAAKPATMPPTTNTATSANPK